MRLGLQGVFGLSITLSAAGVLCGEQITSTCRITAVDAANRTVTLVRKTASGERSGSAKVADNAEIRIAGKAATLASLSVPVDATVIYDTDSRALVNIQVTGDSTSAGSNEPPRAVAPFDAAKAREHQQTWAKHLGVPVEMTNSAGMKLVLVPPGEFEMGIPSETVRTLVEQAKADRTAPPATIESIAGEAPGHRVALARPFLMSRAEVSVSEFRRFAQETKFRTDAETDGKGGFGPNTKTRTWESRSGITWRTPGFAQSDDHPVVNVSWNDAAAFCVWLSAKESKRYRLPTEAEWEYACRAGSATAWSSGAAESSLQTAANLADASALKEKSSWPGGGNLAWDDGFPYTAPAGRFEPNAFGLVDLHGNVQEWCADWYDPNYYRSSPRDDPQGPAAGPSLTLRGGNYLGPTRVTRGGSYFYGPLLCRSACRQGQEPSNRNGYRGFRIVCEIEPPK